MVRTEPQRALISQTFIGLSILLRCMNKSADTPNSVPAGRSSIRSGAVLRRSTSGRIGAARSVRDSNALVIGQRSEKIEISLREVMPDDSPAAGDRHVESASSVGSSVLATVAPGSRLPTGRGLGVSYAPSKSRAEASTPGESMSPANFCGFGSTHAIAQAMLP